MRRCALALVLPALALAALPAGCGGQAPRVFGDVTLDGQPVADGSIAYVPVDPKTPKVEVKVQDGKYSARVPPGAYRVQVSWVKPTGQKRKMYPTPDSPMVDVTAESIPEKYNEKTELQAEIKPGDNKYDWPLKSK
jgi:hypothetical protein